jgi:hypothetical protein
MSKTPRRAPRAPQPASAAAPVAPPPPVHKPRSLAAEVGIIVLGVLIALAAQQAADLFRWRQDVGEMRRALAGELTADANVLRWSQRQNACNLAHLDALGAWARGEIPDNPNNRFRGPGLPGLGMSVWEVAKTGQVAAHMPLKDRLAYANIYDGMANEQALVATQRDVWRGLTSYADKPNLDPEEARGLLEQVSQARNIIRVWDLNATDLFSRLGKLGLEAPPRLAPFRVPDDCRPANPNEVLGGAPAAP